MGSAGSKERFCQKCGAVSPPGHAFCFKCGSRLYGDDWVENVCWNCQAPLDSQKFAYCPKCGVPVAQGRAPAASGLEEIRSVRRIARARGPSRPRVWTTVVLGVGLVLLVGLLVSGYGDRLLGRNYYVGNSPPVTNVTVLDVNVTQVEVFLGTTYTISTMFVPSNWPMFNVGGKTINFIMTFDETNGPNLTISDVAGQSGFHFAGGSPSIPHEIPRGSVESVTFYFTVAAVPGFYTLHATLSET